MATKKTKPVEVEVEAPAVTPNREVIVKLLTVRAPGLFEREVNHGLQPAAINKLADEILAVLN